MTVYTGFHPTSLYADDSPRLARGVTIASGANTSGNPLKRGTLLGRVTATDKYIPCVKTASDGSQNPAAVLAQDVDASAADAGVSAYQQGSFAYEVMIIDGSWTFSTLDAALRIAGSQIFVRSVGAVA